MTITFSKGLVYELLDNIFLIRIISLSLRRSDFNIAEITLTVATVVFDFKNVYAY